MNFARKMIFSLLLMLAAGHVNAGCLSDYNSYLYVCDQYACPNGVFTCMGCYADALVDYYSCVEEKITS